MSSLRNGFNQARLGGLSLDASISNRSQEALERGSLGAQKLIALGGGREANKEDVDKAMLGELKKITKNTETKGPVVRAAR